MFTAGVSAASQGLSWPWIAGNFLFVAAAIGFVAGGVKSLPNSSLKRTDQSLRD
jgi:hypothetical protein